MIICQGLTETYEDKSTQHNTKNFNTIRCNTNSLAPSIRNASYSGEIKCKLSRNWNPKLMQTFTNPKIFQTQNFFTYVCVYSMCVYLFHVYVCVYYECVHIMSVCIFHVYVCVHCMSSKSSC